MKTIKEIIEQINAAKLDTPYYVEDLDCMQDAKELDTIDLDEHRWFTNGTVVYQLGDEFFGVFGPVHINSESMYWSDCGCIARAFEMEQVPSVTYKRKK